MEKIFRDNGGACEAVATAEDKTTATAPAATTATAPSATSESAPTPTAPRPLCGVGGVVLAEGEISYNTSRPTATLKVRNTGDRPIQVGSHFHFFEANRLLDFDRAIAFGMHLNIPATTAIRFEPGQEREVELVGFGGRRRVVGFGGLTEGSTEWESGPSYTPVARRALHRAVRRGYRHTPQSTPTSTTSSTNKK